MVGSVTALGKSGLSDWFIQRVTAVIMLAFVIFMFVYFIINLHPTYEQWELLFSNGWMRIFTFLFFLSIFMHAWIGMWIITTDYLKSTVVRITVQVLVILTLLACLVWLIEILWGL